MIPLLFAGGVDAIGLMGLAASCANGHESLADVHELIVSVEHAWASLADLDQPTRQAETRKLFRVIGLAQALTVYG